MISETLITAATTPMIQTLVKELFAPKLTSFLQSAKIKTEALLNQHEAHFYEYLNRTYDKYNTISVLAIPNSQFKLKSIYVSQSLVKENRFDSKSEATRIDHLPKTLIKKYKKILIKDTAGMGKSTIMKYMFIEMIDKGIKDIGIPIYIELNRLNRKRTLINVIQSELNSLSKEFDSNLLLNFIQDGGFIFFLDGYDEISIADRIEVTRDIQNFISTAGTDNYFILASRPDDSLSCFADFKSFNIQPLKREEAFELLSKYDISNQKKVSAELIKELNTGKYHSIDEYLQNPLLVSLLYNAFNYKAEIPLKKHQFYRQVYDALFNAHKLAQGQEPHEKRSGLDIDDFNRVLRYVGYQCLREIGVQFDKDTILNSIEKAKSFCGNLSFSRSAFLEDLMTSVPLFNKDGVEYKWAHKSLMEYFAARFIADDTKEKQDKILSAIYNSKNFAKYINMLDLYFDIDYKGFSKNITLPFCKQFLDFYNEQIIEYRNTGKHRGIPRDLIEERIGLLFFSRWAFTWNLKKGNRLLDESFKLVQFHKYLGQNAKILDHYFFNNRIIWVAYDIHKSIIIARLLHSKKHDLFIDVKYNSTNKINDLLNSVITTSQNVISFIGLNQGQRNTLDYKKMNNLMRQQIEFYLSYDFCESEVKRINEELSQNDNDDLLSIE